MTVLGRQNLPEDLGGVITPKPPSTRVPVNWPHSAPWRPLGGLPVKNMTIMLKDFIERVLNCLLESRGRLVRRFI